jgi:hypothetical protein
MQFADNFRGYMVEVAEAIDQEMGEMVTVTPVFNKANFAPVAEPARSVNVVAVFAWISETGFSSTDSKRTSGNREIDLAPLVQTRKPRFSFKANCLPWPILRSYLIQRRCDASIWQVTAVKPDGVSRIECAVLELGRQTQ